MDKNQFNQALIEFLNGAPTPFHAVATMAQALTEAGFKAPVCDNIRDDIWTHWTELDRGRYKLDR